jgi:uncharacterized protein DUF5343
MANDKQFPYATSQPGLKRILEGIPTWGTPTKVDRAWLAGVGFSGGAGGQSLAVLRGVGIVGADGKPTDLWNAFRTQDRAAVAAGLRKHYADLFALYEDANRKDQEAVLAFVRSKTTYGADAQKKAVATFKTLCAFGDFAADAPDGDDGEDEPEIKAPRTPKGKPSTKKEGAGGGSVALTVNIQLQLPENASGDVYEKLFAAMAKHLKGLIGTE